MLVYIPSKDPINKGKLQSLRDQIFKPFILLGDFNSHNIAWGIKDTGLKGKILGNESDICLLNKGEHICI